MITSHIQWKDYMVLNDERIYVHAIILDENLVSLKAIKDDKDVLIRLKPTDMVIYNELSIMAEGGKIRVINQK